jgi:serine protease Do
MRSGLGAICAGMMLWASGAQAADDLSVTSNPGPPAVAAKPLPLGAKPRSVSLARVGDSMKYGQFWAGIMWGKDCKWDTDVTWDTSKFSIGKTAVTERLFRDTLASLGFAVAGDPNNLFKDDSDDGAELQVGALVTDISLIVCGGFASGERKLSLNDAQAVGDGQMAVEWQIYSPIESRVVAKIPTVARVVYKDNHIHISDALIEAVFVENVKALAASEAFRTAVLSAGPSLSAPRKPAENPPITLPQAKAAERPLPEASGSVMALFAGDGMGSGFLISRDGYILTNRHVVGAAKYLKVKWSDGIETVGEVVRTDAGRDIALVKTDPRGRQPFALRHTGVQAGDTVFAIGTPLDARLQGSITRGVVSGNRMFDGYNFIQSDVVVNPGNSGGPLLDDKGAVVGVTVSRLDHNDSPLGINFFIPIDDALTFLSLKTAP